MKKIVASVGLVAVGASGLQAALLPALTEDSGKPWSLSATLRGFYDDNINCLPDNANIAHRSTTGFELSPSLQFSFPMDQTTLDFGYVVPTSITRTSPWTTPIITIKHTISMLISPTHSASGIKSA